MARKVFVSSDMSHDEKLINVSEECPEAALIWPWIVTYFDDWGRAEAQSKRIKAKLFPMNELVTVELVERALQLFADHDLITMYEVDGKTYMAVEPEKWWKYQTHIHRSKRDNDNSKFPPPPSGQSSDTSLEDAESRGGPRVFAPSPSTLPPFHPTERLVCSGEPNDTTAPPSGRLKNDYPSDFEMFWEAYPRKKEKRTAFKAWKARLREDKNLTPESLIAAAKHYADECAAKGTDPEYIKHGSTFLSKSKPFEDYLEGVWDASPRASRASPDGDSPGLSAALRSARRRLQEAGEEAIAR